MSSLQARAFAGIVALAIVHEWLFVGRPIEFALIRTHLFRLPGAKLVFLFANSTQRRLI